MYKKTIALVLILFLTVTSLTASADLNYFAVGNGSRASVQDASGINKVSFIANSNDTTIDVYTNGIKHSTEIASSDSTKSLSFSGNSTKSVELEIKSGGNQTMVWYTSAEYGDGSKEYFSTPSLPPPNPDPPPVKKNACGNPRWDNPIKNWVDDIFCPVITFLDLAKKKLADVRLVTAQGLNIGQYFKIFGDLPASWQLVITSLLLMITTLGGLLIFRSAMRIYYAIKEGVKWW